jgi:hypothetical protein
MNNKQLRMKNILLLAIAVLLFAGCEKKTPEEIKYIEYIKELRQDKDKEFAEDPDSPFNRDGKAVFHALNYFEPDPDFVFYSKLFLYEKQDTINISGTKGEERTAVRTGYVKFGFNGKEYKLNVYEGTTGTNDIYHSIWFTDKTTNKETYGVGRYLDFEKFESPDNIYKIDFNLAYSPYCSYSSIYSCAIPSKEDYLDLAVEAGEKKFHE